MPKFKHIVVLSDGIRGHYHQSLGIARCIERLGGGHVEPVIHIPKLERMQKIRMKLAARKLASGNPDYARKWMNDFHVSADGIEPDTLFISAGSSVAPFCLALARSTGNKCAVVMTPSILGTKPFDFAVIPDHDKHDPNDKNIITTLGAPNHIHQPELREVAQKFMSGKNLKTDKIAALLIGGNDANYNITPQWIRDVIAPIKYIDDITILITTSRRTGKAVEDALADVFSDCPSVAYMMLFSRQPNVNSITAILGSATHVMVTDDSVSMVSEAVTAGFRVGLLRVPRIKSFTKNLLGYGAIRFDRLFASMIERDLIEDLGEVPDFEKFLEPHEQKQDHEFNEAKRAAEWIIEHP